MGYAKFILRRQKFHLSLGTEIKKISGECWTKIDEDRAGKTAGVLLSFSRLVINLYIVMGML